MFSHLVKIIIFIFSNIVYFNYYIYILYTRLFIVFINNITIPNNRNAYSKQNINKLSFYLNILKVFVE